MIWEMRVENDSLLDLTVALISLRFGPLDTICRGMCSRKNNTGAVYMRVTV